MYKIQITCMINGVTRQITDSAKEFPTREAAISGARLQASIAGPLERKVVEEMENGAMVRYTRGDGARVVQVFSVI